MPEESFKENDIFGMEKVVGSALELSAAFLIGQVPIKKYGLKNSVFANTPPPFSVTKLILLHKNTVVNYKCIILATEYQNLGRLNKRLSEVLSFP